MADLLFEGLRPKVWHVVFGPARAPVALPWGLARLGQAIVHRQPANWQHCWAFTVTRFGWLVVYPGLDGLAVDELPSDLPDRLKAERQNPLTVLTVNEQRPGALRINWTCARTVAALVGARNFRGVMPRQLCRHLIHHQRAEIIHGRID